jgi:hypothetical protein
MRWLIAALDQCLLPLVVADFDYSAAAAYGEMRAAIERQGRPLGSLAAEGDILPTSIKGRPAGVSQTLPGGPTRARIPLLLRQPARQVLPRRTMREGWYPNEKR